jgi:cytochrome c553
MTPVRPGFISLAALLLWSAQSIAAVVIPAELAAPLQACTGCHGEDGNGAKRTYPFINWQLPKYLEDQMVGFQEGTQPTRVPKHVPKTITREHIRAIAVFYGQQTPEREKPAFDATKAAAGKAVFERRCKDCHLDAGRASNNEEPVLAGQPAEYLLAQEMLYGSGKRKYSPKADEAHLGMSDADRETVSHYLASQDVKPTAPKRKKRN